MNHSNIVRHSCVSLGSCEAINVYLFKNGQKDVPPRKYHLTRNDLKFWNDTLKSVADIETELFPSTKDNQLELYKLNGQKIGGPLELEDGAAYVVVQPNETFRDSGYESYMVQASKSMEKRFKQTGNKDIIVNTVSTYNKFAGRKFKKKINSQETGQKTDPKTKIGNLAQINNVSNNRTWPVKKKEELVSQKGARPTSLSPRKPSPVKKGVKKKESLTLQQSDTRTVSREMLVLNKKNGTLEGAQNLDTNGGRLLDLFRDMNIQRNLEHENTRLLILLNEKKMVSKIDTGIQSLMVQIDEGTDPPINLIEYDEKGIQKPSNTSVCRNFSDDNYVALMQPDALINITIQASQAKDCIETNITGQKNVKIIKLEDKLKDKAAEFCIDTPLSDKTIIDTKIIKFVAIRCISNKLEPKDLESNESDSINNTKKTLPSTVLDLGSNGNRRIAENHETEDREIKQEVSPFPTPSHAHSLNIENNFESEKISKNTTDDSNFKETTLKNMSQTKVSDNETNSKLQEEQNINLSRGSLNTLQKVSNEDETTPRKKTASEASKKESSTIIYKIPKKVSMCLDGNENCIIDVGEKHPPIVEEPITLLDVSERTLNATSRKFSVTIETCNDELYGSNPNASNIVLPTRQAKSCDIMKDEAEALLSLLGYSPENVLESKQSESNNEISTLSNIHIVKKSNQENQTSINATKETTDKNGIDYGTQYSNEPSTSKSKDPSSSQTCYGCNYIPPPCVPNCTPINCVTPANSRHNINNYQCSPNTTSEYIQTDSCEVLLMVRRQRDNSQFSFHFPSIKDLKDYKLI